MLRRAFAAVAASAVVLGGLALSATPAGADVSSDASISPSVWQPGEQAQAVVSWTESLPTRNNPAGQRAYNATPGNSGDYLSVEVGWGWTMANRNPTATAVAYTASWSNANKAYSCGGPGMTYPIVFSSDGFGNVGGNIQCLVKRASANQNNSDDPGQQVILSNVNDGVNNASFTLAAGSVITVRFAAGQVTAPASGPASDTWRIISFMGNDVAGNTTTVRTVVPAPDGSVPAPPPPVKLEFDGNGGSCSPSFVEGEKGTWGTALTADQCTNGSRQLAFFSTSPTAAVGATNVRPGGPIFFLEANRLYAIWAPDKPSPVTDVVATPGLNSVKVTWKAPVSDGGDPINSYCIALRTDQNPNPFPRCANAAQPLDLTFSLPATNTKYTPTVFARNSAGSSEPVAGAPASPYDIRGVTASRKDLLLGLGGTQVEARGDAPGLAGLTLNVEYKVGAAEWTTQANAVSVDAASKFRWSKKFPRSSNKNAVTVRFTYGADAVSGTYVLPRGGRAGDLSAPRNIKATGELNRISLTWDPPKFDGGAKIIGYTICAEYIGTLCRDVGPAGQGDLRNLLPGAEYSFTVAARTAAKTGPKAKANKDVKFTEASVRIAAREPGRITILAEGRGFPNSSRVRLEVAPVSTTNQPRDRWRWVEIRSLAGGNRFSKTVEAELDSIYNDQSIVVRLVTPLGSVYSKASRPPR